MNPPCLRPFTFHIENIGQCVSLFVQTEPKTEKEESHLYFSQQNKEELHLRSIKTQKRMNSDRFVSHYNKTDIAALLHVAQAKSRASFLCASSSTTTVDDLTTTTTSSSSSSSFTYQDLVKIQAPMVRCSRPPFRKLCRLWGTDISYTHMIVAESFVKSAEARHSDFALYEGEDRLVVQLAGKDPVLVAQAAAYVAPYCDAVDLNCGCPQRWAMQEGLGAALLKKPELVASMVAAVRSSGADIPCVVKMRVDDDIRKSVDFARQCEAAGAAWITVHGRTPTDTPNAVVRREAIVTIRESLSVPVVANGSVTSPHSAMELACSTGVGAVMSARGLLDNPAAFYQGDAAAEAGVECEMPTPSASASSVCNSLSSHPLATLRSDGICPEAVIAQFLRLAAACDLPYKATQHHLLLMGNDHWSPMERLFLSQQKSCAALVQALRKIGMEGI